MAKKPNPFAGKETKAEEKAEMKGGKAKPKAKAKAKGKKLPPWLMKGKDKQEKT